MSGNERRQVAADTPDYRPTVVERSGPAIRAALLVHAPERCVQFETEFRGALVLAAENLDLSGPEAVLAHWQAVAMMAANPLTDEEREQIERAKAGDYSGLLTWQEGEVHPRVAGQPHRKSRQAVRPAVCSVVDPNRR